MKNLAKPILFLMFYQPILSFFFIHPLTGMHQEACAPSEVNNYLTTLLQSGTYNEPSLTCDDKDRDRLAFSMINASQHAMNVIRDPIIVKHSRAITDLQSDTTGRYWVTVSADDGVAHIVDILKEKVLHASKHQGRIASVAVSLDNQKVAISSLDGTVRIIPIGENTIGAEDVTVHHNTPVYRVRFSADSNHLITASDDGKVRLLDAPYWKETQSVAFGKKIKNVLYNKTETRVAALIGDNIVKVVNSLFSDAITIFHNDWINEFQWSPGGDKLATASNDSTAKLVDIANRREVVLPHDEPVRSIHFNGNGDKFLTTSDDEKIRIFDVATQKLLKVISDSFWFYRAKFGVPDNQIFMVSDNCAKLIDYLTGRTEAVIKSREQAEMIFAELSQDGQHVLVASSDGKVQFLNPRAQKACVINDQSPLLKAGMSPEATSLATGSQRGEAKLWPVGLHHLASDRVIAVAAIIRLSQELQNGECLQPLKREGWAYKIFMQEKLSTRKRLMTLYPGIKFLLKQAAPPVEGECCICLHKSLLHSPCDNNHPSFICATCIPQMSACPLCNTLLPLPSK